MVYKIIIESEALQDLLNIKTYITQLDSLNKANKFISELKKNIKALNEMPQRCRRSYYADIENTHDLIYKKYTIVFQVIDSSVHILTIFKQREY